MAVKPMTQQGLWVCFGPDRAFAYKIEICRVTPFESTPNGWNLSVKLRAPNDANSKLQEVMDMVTAHTIKQMLTGPQKTHPFELLDAIV